MSHYAGRDWALTAKKAGVLDNIRFEAFDASKLPFESEAFDAVFFFGVLHHIDENVRSEVFREALRVSKENGVVVFFEPRKEMLERIWSTIQVTLSRRTRQTIYPTRGTMNIGSKVP